MKLCTNNGCNVRFGPETTSECWHHPGAPVFHEGLKGWSCCKKRETHFDDFLNIPGCTMGRHQHVEKKKEPKKKPVQQTSGHMVSSTKDGKEVYTSRANPKLKAKGKSNSRFQKKVAPVERPDAVDAVIARGAKCLHNGCGATFRGEESRTEPCVYHKGQAIFHEASKFWSCCRQGTLEFEEMLKQPGCSTGRHKFVPDQPEDVVTCRHQSYQMGNSVVIDVFARQADKEASVVEFTPFTVKLDLLLGNGSRFKKTFELAYAIVPEESKARFATPKVEITLRKEGGENWSEDLLP